MDTRFQFSTKHTQLQRDKLQTNLKQANIIKINITCIYSKKISQMILVFGVTNVDLLT